MILVRKPEAGSTILTKFGRTRPNIAYSVSVIIQFMHNSENLISKLHIGFCRAVPGKEFCSKGIISWPQKLIQTLTMQIPWWIEDQPLNIVLPQGGFSNTEEQKAEHDLRIELKGPIKLYCDNKSAINIAYNPLQQDRMYVICSINTTTGRCSHKKGLNSSTFHDLIIKLGMEDIYSSI
ncbi:hypothetical protein CR513_50031, partial [Mucuna pruriens]